MLNKNEILSNSADLLRELESRARYEVITSLFPDNGPLRRDLYPRHIEYFNAGAQYPVVCFMAANQIGKTTATCYELTLHMRGVYPPWWNGKRFNKPIKAWAVGYSSERVRTTLQRKLLGNIGDWGSGLVPRKVLDLESMVEAKKADSSVQTFRVKHISGGYSSCDLKSYESGRRAFEGEPVDFILLDEEPPVDVYSECVARTIATGGCIRFSFTPLLGLTEVIATICGGDDWTLGKKTEYNYLVGCTWDDVPHITEESKQFQLSNTPEYIKDARSKGIPQLGSGAVFATQVERVLVDPMPIPRHWKRVYAMDFGWDTTSIIWGAIDTESNKKYITHEYYEHNKQPIYHAQAIKQMNRAAGYDITGICDPAGGGRGQHDGKNTREMMASEYDIILESADNSIEPGLMLLNDWFATQQLFIFNTCKNLISEYRVLRRNDKGKIIGKDHAVDCVRYLANTGFKLATNASSKVDWDKERAKASWADEMLDNSNDAWLYK